MKIFNYFFTIIISVLVLSCESEPVVEYKINEGKVTDFHGKTYKTVKIGNQWWMAEDLVTTRFNDGSKINELKEPTEWKNNVGPAMIMGNNTSLYNFAVINDTRGVAPFGWRIPTDEDWKLLERHIGMSESEIDKNLWRGSLEGDKLKSSYQSRGIWLVDGQVWGEDTYGFAAKPSGCVLPDGRPSVPGPFHQGFWWTSTMTENEAWFRNLDYKESRIFRYFAHPNYGFSVRCVKD